MQALTTGTYSSDWKKGNTVSVRKKGVKQNIKNCYPYAVSLPPICGNVFERILYNPFSFFLESTLITQK